MRPLVFALSVLAALPSAGRAQAIATFGGSVMEADLLYFAGRPRDAYDLLRAHLEREPSDYEALWRAARAAVVIGIGEARVGAAQNVWFDPAIELGDQAVMLRPGGIDGLYWRGAAMGRRAMNAGPSNSARLAQLVWDDANSILGLDPDHGGAHNLLGVLNFEIMSLSRIERFLGRTFTSSRVLRDSSWQAAEEHLLAAAARWPDMVVFQFDVAQLYLKRGREDEARMALRRLTQMPPIHPLDASLQQDAVRLLEELGS